MSFKVKDLKIDSVDDEGFFVIVKFDLDEDAIVFLKLNVSLLATSLFL